MSPRKAIVETYFEGFRRGDNAQILGCLTDDVAVESYLVPLTEGD